jgi:hypothetical protein
MRKVGKTMSVVLLGSLIAACTATDGVKTRDAGTNPPAQVAEAAPSSEGSVPSTEEGDVTSRLVLPDDPCRYNPGMRCRAYKNQLASKLPPGMGLMVPAPPQAMCHRYHRPNERHRHVSGDDYNDQHQLSPHGNPAMGGVRSSQARAWDCGKSVQHAVVDHRKRQ